MTFDYRTPSGQREALILHRGDDRRHSEELVTPPYLTDEGMVLVDRRSHIERRSCWIRQFRLDVSNQEH